MSSKHHACYGQPCELQAQLRAPCELQAQLRATGPPPHRVYTRKRTASSSETARWPTSLPTQHPKERSAARRDLRDERAQHRRPNTGSRPGAGRMGEEANANPQPIGETAVCHRAPESARRPWGATEGNPGRRKPSRCWFSPCVPALGTLMLPFGRESSTPAWPSSKPDSSLSPKAEAPAGRARWTCDDDDATPPEG